jgi:hypothetical protein
MSVTPITKNEVENNLNKMVEEFRANGTSPEGCSEDSPEDLEYAREEKKLKLEKLKLDMKKVQSQNRSLNAETAMTVGLVSAMGILSVLGAVLIGNSVKTSK